MEMLILTIVITVVTVAICYAIMAVGLLQGKTITSCGRAAENFGEDGEPSACSLCANKGKCKKKKA